MLKLNLKLYTKKKKLGTGLKMLTPKQILQSLPIPPTQVKPCNNSKGLLN